MKTYILLFCTLIFTCELAAQDTIRIEDVSKHIGDSVTICSKIFGGIYMEKSKSQPTFLNMGAAYPNQLLTIVIWKDARKYFKKPPETALLNREICITGKIIEYNGKPEIVFQKPEQMFIK